MDWDEVRREEHRKNKENREREERRKDRGGSEDPWDPGYGPVLGEQEGEEDAGTSSAKPTSGTRSPTNV